MEILFEFIGDMVFELLLAGGEHAVTSSKTPKPLRIILASLALLFFIAIIGLIIWAGIAAIMNGSVAGGIAILALAVLFTVLVVRKLYRRRFQNPSGLN